jgi:hypothetical protein
MRSVSKEVRQLVILLVITLVIFLLGLSTGVIETFYVNGLYPIISGTLRYISSLLPFPLGDFLYLLLIIYILWQVFLFCKRILKKQLRRSDALNAFVKCVNFTLILYIAFKLLWGLNYSRLPIAGQLGIGNEKYDSKELLLLGKFLISQINNLQEERAKNPAYKNIIYAPDALQNKAVKSYARLTNKNNFFRYPNPALKRVLNSYVITKIGLEGYYNPLSGEANVNMLLNSQNLPFVACHEISHQLGIAREDEANLVGYLVSTSSSDLNFRYSGIYCVLKNVLFEIAFSDPEAYKKLKETINAATLADFKKDREFWRKYNNDMFGYMDVALDQFLKLNSQKKGIDSYQDIVIWLYNYHINDLKRYELKSKTLQP